MKDVKKFFHEQGIQIVTIQPEFNSTKPMIETTQKTIPDCLVPCQDYACMEKHCCVHNRNDLKAIKINDKLTNSKMSTCCAHDKKTETNKEIIISAVELKNKDKQHNIRHSHSHQYHKQEDEKYLPKHISEIDLNDNKQSIKSIKSVVSLSALSNLRETINDGTSTHMVNEREFVSDTELNQHENINNINLDKEKSPEIQDLHNLDNKNINENINSDTETNL